MAREALDHPKVPMTDMETMTYEAQIRGMTEREKTRRLTEGYIDANTVANDPESIWGLARALGVSDDQVGRMINNTTVRIRLLQIDKHSPGVTAEQVLEIDKQLDVLYERQAIERYQATPVGARIPPTP